MKIEQASEKTMHFDVVKRSRFDFEPKKYHITIAENNEKLITQQELEQAGIVCEPYWDTESDLEGDSYHSYIATHPGFSLSVRHGVYTRLLHVQKQLPASWQLILKAGYRPYSVQLDLLEAFIKQARRDHPNWSEKRLQTHGRIFVSDPHVVCPPHVTGGAVDIDVRNCITGSMVDFGCPPNTDSELAFLHSNLLTKQQYANRMTLLHAMLDAEFAPLASEWWHYQYGETYWAAFYGYKTTKYDLLGYNKE